MKKTKLVYCISVFALAFSLSLVAKPADAYSYGHKGHSKHYAYKGSHGYYKRGHRSYRGKRSFRGHRSHRGKRSFRGHRGFRSKHGFRGHRGKHGFRGHRGFRGHKGFRGHRGHRGFRGRRGHRGFGHHGVNYNKLGFYGNVAAIVLSTKY